MKEKILNDKVKSSSKVFKILAKGSYDFRQHSANLATLIDSDGNVFVIHPKVFHFCKEMLKNLYGTTIPDLNLKKLEAALQIIKP